MYHDRRALNPFKKRSNICCCFYCVARSSHPASPGCHSPSEAGSLVLDVKLEAVGDEVSAIAFAEVGGAVGLQPEHSHTTRVGHMFWGLKYWTDRR